MNSTDAKYHGLRSPVFSVQPAGYDSPACLVSAGGGGAKTGVKNVLSLFTAGPVPGTADLGARSSPSSSSSLHPTLLHTFDTGAELVFAASASAEEGAGAEGGGAGGGRVLAALSSAGAELFSWDGAPGAGAGAGAGAGSAGAGGAGGKEAFASAASSPPAPAHMRKLSGPLPLVAAASSSSSGTSSSVAALPSCVAFSGPCRSSGPAAGVGGGSGLAGGGGVVGGGVGSRLLAVGCEDGGVHIFDAERAEAPVLLARIRAEDKEEEEEGGGGGGVAGGASSSSAAAGGSALVLSWSPCGRLLAAAYASGAVRVFAVGPLLLRPRSPQSQSPGPASLVFHTLPSQGASVLTVVAAAAAAAAARSNRGRRSGSAGGPVQCEAKGLAWEEDEEESGGRGDGDGAARDAAGHGVSLYVLESSLSAGGGALVRWRWEEGAGGPGGAGGAGGGGKAGGGAATRSRRGAVALPFASSAPASSPASALGAGGAGAGAGAGGAWVAKGVRLASRSSPLTCLASFYTPAPSAFRLLVGAADGAVQCWSGAHLSMQWERKGVHAMGVSGLAALAALVEGPPSSSQSKAGATEGIEVARRTRRTRPAPALVGVSGSPDGFVACFPLTAPPSSFARLFGGGGGGGRGGLVLSCRLCVLILLALLVAVAVGCWLLLARHAQKAILEGALGAGAMEAMEAIVAGRVGGGAASVGAGGEEL